MNIDICNLNNVANHLIGESMANLPNGYDTNQTELRRLAKEGNHDAAYIVRLAKEGNQDAMEYAGSRWN